MKTYYRPTGFVLGRDVVRMVRDGDALPLAGMDHVGFTHVDVITRSGGKIERDNDVSALGHDPKSAGIAAMAGCPVILMHAQGEPKTMQLQPKYEDVLLDVYDGLETRVDAAVAGGIARGHIAIDPGIGFGKTFQQNLELLSGLPLFHGLGLPLVIGLSRKGFIGALTGEKVAGHRIHGSVGGALESVLLGAHILRVHDVKATREALAVFAAAIHPDSADI